ncbi:MAG: hypothetical protein QXV81_08845 [Ignisphaera sp.]
MFEARYHRFCTIRSMSLLSEKLYGPLQVKHTIYLMFSILFFWRGLSIGNAKIIVFALVVAFMGFLSAVLGTKSMSFESKLLLTILSLIDSSFSPEPRLVRRKPGGARGRGWIRLIKILAPALVIGVPPMSLAVAVVVYSDLHEYAKMLLIAYIASSLAIPIALGLRK